MSKSCSETSPSLNTIIPTPPFLNITITPQHAISDLIPKNPRSYSPGNSPSSPHLRRQKKTSPSPNAHSSLRFRCACSNAKDKTFPPADWGRLVQGGGVKHALASIWESIRCWGVEIQGRGGIWGCWMNEITLRACLEGWCWCWCWWYGFYYVLIFRSYKFNSKGVTE